MLFRSEAHLDGLVLHDLGPFPMAVLGDGRVWGELYAVDPEGLARLDALEGYPRLYDRRQMAVADGRQAWVYVGRPRQVRHAPIVSGGTWQASRNHQLDGGRDGDPAPTSTPNPPPSLL